jgi:nucleoside-diphosphate-sugar epimerase
MRNKINILVTGATGFIGSHLCKDLVGEGYNVFGLFLEGKKQNVSFLLKEKNFHLLKGDVRDFKEINKIIKGKKIKIIFHLAATLPKENDIEEPFRLFEVNAKGTLNLLNIAYRNKIRKFIYASTSSVYSTPPEYLPVDEKHPTFPSTIYGASKLEGELYCNIYSKKMDIMVLRYCGAYGIGQDEHYATYRFVKQALNNESITIYGDGSQSTNFTYIGDIIKGTILAMKKNKPGTYNISSGQKTSIKDLARMIIKLSGSKSKIIFSNKKTDRPFHFTLDIKKSKKELNYFPLSLEDGLRKYIDENKR